MLRCVSFIVVLLSGCATTTEPEQRTEFLNTAQMKAADLPFSDAVRAGKLLFLSGKIGNVPGTLRLAEGGIQAETRQTMENISAALQRYDATMDQVVKCTVFLADMAEWGKMNEVYRTFFPVNKPARSALGVNGLALGARVEIECIAALD
ncbi:MAG: RidA family protein [Gammaproteobacteria bacterium]|nr:RidA family protein [Gammaproteobacteria bacterium]